MIIARRSLISGNVNEMDIPVTTQQIALWQMSGKNIQDVFPQLTDGQREFLMTGITAEEWDRLFPEVDGRDYEDL